MFCKKIIIGGPPRSGTTLLRTILGSTGVLIDVPETSFFLNPICINKNRIERVSKNTNKALDIGEKEIYSIINESPSNEEAFDKMMVLYAKKNHHDKILGWIEKTPRNCFHYNRIALEMNECFFISIVRDGRTIVTSQIEDGAYWCSIDRYIDSMRCVYGFDSEKHLIVHYEDLVENTDIEVEKIFVFLGFDQSQVDFKLSDLTLYQKAFDISKVRQKLIRSPIKNYSKERRHSSEHVKKINEFESTELAMFFDKKAGYL